MREGTMLVIDLETIERTIQEIEATKDTTYHTCERLAWLYVCRDHLVPQRKDERTQWMSGSEFLELASGVSYPELMRILDEHMSALAVVQPREYESVLQRIKDLR